MSFLNHAMTQIRELASEKPEFTSDDLYLRLEVEPDDPNQIGAAFREAARIGIIQPTEKFVRSKRPASKGRRIGVWEAKNAMALF